MTTLIKRCLVATLLLSSSAAGASSLDITASYGPGNNKFIDTTSADIGYYGTELGLTSTANEPINEGDAVSIGAPGNSRVAILRGDQYGDEHLLTFRITRVGGRYISYFLLGSTSSTGSSAWSNGSWSNPGAPCPANGGSGTQSNSTTGALSFSWFTPTYNAQCTAYSTGDRGLNFKEFIKTGINYEIVYPNPQNMNAGVYRGSITYSVGTGMDFDFGGPKFTNSDTQMTFNFILTVAHGLKLTTTEADRNVSLQPCEPGKVCTAEKGKANWERWSVTQITPQLTGKSGFTLSHSGGNFTAYLQCEYQEGDYCAIKSDKDGRRIPVQTQLTLPPVMVDSNTGAQVINRPLKAGRDTLSNLFRTANAVGEQGGSGHIDFLVKQQDVGTMLKTRPDTYRGAVTVIFDVEL